MKNYLFYLIAIFSGGVGVFAFSPFDFWQVSYFSLLSLIWVIKTAPKKIALYSAFLWGIAFFGFGINWVHISIYQFGGASLIVSYILVILLASYLALYPLLFAYLIRRFNVTSPVIFSIIWTFCEYLRGTLFTGFPWLQFGYTQIDSPFLGLAPLFGVEGLTFFVVWVSAVLFSVISRFTCKPKMLSSVFVQLCSLCLISGLATLSSTINYTEEVENKAINITLIQGNIAQNLKWDPKYLFDTLNTYQKLIYRHLGKTDLIILPESALPIWENNIQPFFTALQHTAQQNNTEIIMGTIYYDENQSKQFNSIINVGNLDLPYEMNTSNRYNKYHLVPFGEYVPLESLLRPLGNVFNLPMSAFHSGETVQPPLLAKKRYFTPAICYEIIFGSQLQQNIRSDSDFILTISNDAWFGNSIGPWQHLQIARMRALELGKPVIRATNTGISVFINAKGKIIAQAPQFRETTLTQKIAPTTGRTPYSIVGNIPLYLLSLLLILLHISMALLKRKLRLTTA